MKNLKSKIKYFVFILLLVPCLLVFTACGASPSEKLAKDLGYSSVEEMLNDLKGKDGKDGKDGADAPLLDTYEMWRQAVENGEFDPNKSYMDFIRELNINSDNTSIVANKCVMSVVTVTASSTGGKSGSGVIYQISDDAAYIITNFHVVSTDSLTGDRATKEYYVTLYGMDNTRVYATYLGGSASYDIAVLKVTNQSSLKILKDANAQAAVFYDGDVKLGMSVLAIGNPRPESWIYNISVSKGVVSVENEIVKISIAGQVSVIEEIRHDCYITNGSSGGGLFNMNGELIGITNGGAESSESINYAIPASTVLGVVRNVIKNCDGTKNNDKIIIFEPFEIQASGISTSYNPHTGYVDLTQTIVISKVNENISYSGLNVLKVGDVVIEASLNISSQGVIQKYITRSFHLERLLLNAQIGDTITLKVMRAGTNETINITIVLDDNIAHYLN